MQDKLKVQIHERAILRGKKYLQSEREVLESIQEVWESKVFFDFGCRNLHEYVVRHMELTDAVAASFIAVAKKAIEVPALKEVIDSGQLQVQKARKVVSVINQENQNFWLDLAVRAPQREIEKQVAKANPEASRPDKVRFISENKLNLKHDVSERVYELIKRVQDLESQRRRKAANLEETLEAAALAYLEKNDPIEKAKRAEIRKYKSDRVAKIISRQVEKIEGALNEKCDINRAGKFESDRAGKSESNRAGNFETTFDEEAPVSRQKQCTNSNDRNANAEGNRRILLSSRNAVDERINSTGDRVIGATLTHQISLRDNCQCTYLDEAGNRCAEKRWLEVHDVVPVSQGGATTLGNLTTLCSGHHKMIHVH